MTHYPVTSLDDGVLTHQNMMLLENVTNLERPAIDYYHCDLSRDDPLVMPQTWNLLLRLGKYKLLRLPSCSAEDEKDYQRYVKRLHHCLWRRWSISYYKLGTKKLDPGAINWNKEQDFTVLYGPDLTVDDERPHPSPEPKPQHSEIEPADAKPVLSLVSSKNVDSEPEDFFSCVSSSLESRDSSIFDHVPSKPCLRHDKSSHRGRRRPLKFNDQVLCRNIDPYGSLCECKIVLNDTHMRILQSESEPEPEADYIQYPTGIWDAESDLDLEFA
ncbi:LAME_0D01508g1_1 [Lachancea meyersii CBS 8951]|uniref:LAME_0D01508g1_1 n=1 Tax=Lachancea meyersii CBS 8951 TaxID=1266667 RepID=A0A1G4J757_9SACH|nr:LAME_0D01508g1_1 [Lachancea meyersii CBS 8951]